MRRRAQRGMTLVELLVAMAVTSILLLGLGNVFLDVSSRYREWAHRLQTASVGVELAAHLQVDVHRLVRCDTTALGTRSYTLDLCPPDARRATVVTYQVSSAAPYVISRQQSGQPAAFMARSTGTERPTFTIDCTDDASTVSGHIHVWDLRLAADSFDPNSDATFSVYYVAPRGTLGCHDDG